MPHSEGAFATRASDRAGNRICVFVVVFVFFFLLLLFCFLFRRFPFLPLLLLIITDENHARTPSTTRWTLSRGRLRIDHLHGFLCFPFHLFLRNEPSAAATPVCV